VLNYSSNLLNMFLRCPLSSFAVVELYLLRLLRGVVSPLTRSNKDYPSRWVDEKSCSTGSLGFGNFLQLDS
jgi:hypothetical protein